MSKTNFNDESKNIVAEGYDRVAQAYADLEHVEEWPRMRWVYKLLEKLDAGGAILDLGCGNGDPADIEMAKQHRVTGIDISAEQVRLAQLNVPNGIFIHSDLGSVEFDEAQFNAIVCFYTIEHLPREEHQAIYEQIFRWLKPNGYFLMCTEADDVEGHIGDWLGVPMFFSSFGPTITLKMIKSAGFTITETANETQIEGETKISYLWVLAQK